MVRGSHLSDKELAAFGVTRTKNKNNRAKYIIPCDICGEPIESASYTTEKIYKCSSCLNEANVVRNKIMEMVQWRNRDLEQYDVGISYEHFNRFEKGAQKFDESYSDAIEKARKHAETFDSIPEVIACIELLHIGAKVIPHQKVGSYTVDFCLPKEKLVIEIDGSLYHKDASKEYWRDSSIKSALGDKWEVKHMPADAVASNHKFFGHCMKRMLNKRRSELKKRR